MPTFEETKTGYKNLWNQAKVTRVTEADKVADKIISNKSIYKDIEKRTGVPWYMVGVLHNRESGMNFETHLHNGDSLQKRTWHVPRGRPLGEPPFTWVESAVDALTMKGLHEIKQWPIERILYECERYNGWGYFNNNYGNSPYVWAGTDQYISGKYIADGRYDANAVDKQLGCAAILKSIFKKQNMKSEAEAVVATVAVGTGVAITQTGQEYWPYIAAGTLIIAAIVFFAVRWFKRRS